jgi:hypothetical protein
LCLRHSPSGVVACNGLSGNLASTGPSAIVACNGLSGNLARNGLSGILARNGLSGILACNGLSGNLATKEAVSKITAIHTFFSSIISDTLAA